MPKNHNTNTKNQTKALLVLALFFLMSLSPLVLAAGPVGGAGQLQAPQEESPEAPWWETWMYDKNHNGIDERIEEKVETDPDTPIPVFVDYTRRPTQEDWDRIEAMGFEPEYLALTVDTIFVSKVLPSEAKLFLELPDVLMVELNPPTERKLDISTPAVKARESAYYSPNTAWELGYTGTDMVIAVLDTGVDDQHEGLAGKFVAGADYSNELFPNDNTNPDDGNGHGTHCAGIVMGTGGNDGDYMGTAPDASLVDVKIGTDVGGNVGGAIIKGIDWCVTHKNDYDISVLSISFGSTSSSDGSDATCRSANDGVDAGLVIVAAAGNDGPNNNGFGAPAAADKVITVGSVTDSGTVSRGDDTIADYSNRGPREDDGDEDTQDELKPEVTAPGTAIMSCNYNSFGQTGVGYVDKTGTSMACPHVSGIAALMLEANPDLTPQQVKDILKESSEQRGEVYDKNLSARYSREYGWGMVDAFEAVRIALGGEIPIQMDVVIKSPQSEMQLTNKSYINATVEINTGEVEKIELLIDGKKKYDEEGVDSISYLWNTKKVRNGPYSLNVTAYSGEEVSYMEIVVYVNNSGGGGGSSEDESDFMDSIKDNMIFVIFAVPILLVLLVGFVAIKRSPGDDDDFEDEEPEAKPEKKKKDKKKKKKEAKADKGEVKKKKKTKKPSTKLCGNCEKELSFIEGYDAWYCYDCEEYGE